MILTSDFYHLWWKGRDGCKALAILVVRKILVKTHMCDTTTSTRMAKIKKTMWSAGKNMEWLELSFNWGSINLDYAFENYLASCIKCLPRIPVFAKIHVKWTFIAALFSIVPKLDTT